MNSHKILVFCTFVCVAVLSACFSPWHPETLENVVYTVTLIDTEGEESEVKSTGGTPIVITVPKGDWKVKVRAVAVGDGWSSFAETPPEFWGETQEFSVSDEEERVTIDTGAMSPSIQVNNWERLSNAFNGSWDAFLKDKVGWKPTGNSQKYYIEITDISSTDYAITSAILDGDSNKNVVLWAKEENKNVSIKRSSTLTDPLFQIRKGTLTLGGFGEGTITIDGDRKEGTNPPNDSLIKVSGGELIIYEGVTITKNKTSKFGGGVHVDGGMFTMNGGEISFNASEPTSSTTGNAGGGGGVYVDNGEFIMNDGSIFENTTKGHGGGVRVFENGKFVMNGGKIYDNESYGFGGGVRVRGTFTMTGGEIYRNEVLKGSDSNNPGYGGGVGVADTGSTSSGSFFMKGGIISNNTANGNGGGLFVGQAGTFSKTGGTISGSGDNDNLPNKAGSGQAIYAENGITSKIKNTTSGQENNLSSSPGSNFSGGWDQ